MWSYYQLAGLPPYVKLEKSISFPVPNAKFKELYGNLRKLKCDKLSGDNVKKLDMEEHYEELEKDDKF